MIPIRDENPSRTVPWITIGIVIVNAVVFLREATLPDRELVRLVYEYGFIPARFWEALRAGKDVWPDAVRPMLTSLFLHGGWLHIIGNMWFLWIFGDNVEDRLGHVVYLMFYLVCGLSAAALHAVIHAGSNLPCLGASGAIAGVLGAYVVCFPRARVLCLFIVCIAGFFVRVPAVVVLLFWFAIQLLAGASTLGVDSSGAGVAYWAHIGGFIMGMILVNLLPRSRASRQSSYEYRRWGRVR